MWFNLISNIILILFTFTCSVGLFLAGSSIFAAYSLLLTAYATDYTFKNYEADKKSLAVEESVAGTEK